VLCKFFTEGLKIAGDHPAVSYSIIAGAGLLLAKRELNYHIALIFLFPSKPLK
jgi:hypothetical protein